MFFKRPVLLPSKVELKLHTKGSTVLFHVTSAGGERLLMEGRVQSV